MMSSIRHSSFVISPRRLKTGYCVLTWLHIYAVAYYSNYLFFHLRDAFGFSSRQNLLVAALVGLIYVPASWCGGRFAQRRGYFTALKLGLGGIAKGWGVDQAVARLRSLGFRDFFVQAGGDLYAAGKKDEHPWRVGIRDPRGPPEKTFALLDVSDAAFSTSGDYEQRPGWRADDDT